MKNISYKDFLVYAKRYKLKASRLSPRIIKPVLDYLEEENERINVESKEELAYEALIISSYLGYRGERVLLYSADEGNILTNPAYLRFVDNNSEIKEYLNEVTFANSRTITNIIEEEYDIILVIDIGDVVRKTEVSKRRSILNLRHKEGREFIAKIVELFEIPYIIFHNGESEYTDYGLIKNSHSVRFNVRIDKEVNIVLQPTKEVDLVEKIDRVQTSVDTIFQKITLLSESFDILKLNFEEAKKKANNEDDQEEGPFDGVYNLVSAEMEKMENEAAYKNFEKLLIARMGQAAWSKLSRESKIFLITAKFYFYFNMTVGNNLDYSSVCLLTCKALEVEVYRRFVKDYIYYLKMENYSLEDYPKDLKYFDKKMNCEKELSKEKFMMGSFAFVIGHYRGASNEDRDRFEEYAHHKLLSRIPRSDLYSKLEKYRKSIKKINEEYRRPAAHKDSMNLMDASACLDYVLEVDRILQTMLDDFDY